MRAESHDERVSGVCQRYELLITLGLILGALSYFLKRDLIPGLAPLEDALAVVASIGITMLGSLPLAEFLRRLMRKTVPKAGTPFWAQ